ncbi:cell division topological specificity factor MinE [Arenibaculum pallidiluteum]|uniref:cell division topological specificity factor MinE n=1 Tax=Arenibaculum pallidiluteum TaxID=2812559 RepID=UPI001A97250D|nr:cell division topological specificity factor MinE [Arenibaculum pallidiluteum]
MSIFNFFRTQKKTVAEEAKERLQIVLAHERGAGSSPDYLPMLQKELLDVIKKYVRIDEDKVEVKLERGGDFSTLEVNIELPPPAVAAQRRRQAAAGGGVRPA